MSFIDFISQYGLIAGYILIALAIVSAVVLPLINAISNPKSLLMGAVGLVAIGLIFLIGYALADNEVTTTYINAGVGETGSQLVGGLLITMYIILGASVIGIIFTEILNILK